MLRVRHTLVLNISCFRDPSTIWGIFVVQGGDSMHWLMQQILPDIILDSGGTVVQTKPLPSRSSPSTGGRNTGKYKQVDYNIMTGK